MTAGVVTVGRHRYAVGLYWENSPGGGRVAQIAKEAARQPGQQADFYVVRPGNKDGRVPQFGLCSKDSGQVAGMPVLAACLVGQIPGSWVGAWRLNEGVVVIVVRDDLIVPDGDLFYLDEAGARDRLIQEVGFGGLQSVYAPEAWSIPGADTIPLSLLINDKADVKLQRVVASANAKVIAIGISFAFILILSGVWYYQKQVDEENERQALQQEALRRAQQVTNLPGFLAPQVQPEAKYDRSWERAPAALAVIKNCQDGLSKVPAAMSGWKISTMTCSGASINLTWNREKGASQPPAEANVNDLGTVATQTISLPPMPPRGAESLANKEEITSRYLLQDWTGTISRTADDPPPPPPPGYTGQWNPPPAPWVKRSFTVHVPELPSELPDWFGNLPGVLISSMSCASGQTGCAWTVEGVIYENRK